MYGFPLGPTAHLVSEDTRHTAHDATVERAIEREGKKEEEGWKKGKSA